MIMKWILFSVLLLEVAVVIIGLSKSSDLMSDPLKEFVAKLPDETQGLTNDEIIDYIDELALRPTFCTDCNKQTNVLSSTLQDGLSGDKPNDAVQPATKLADYNLIQGELATCEQNLSSYEAETNNLMIQIAFLSAEVKKVGSTINFRYNSDSESKKIIAYRTLEVLGELGHYRGEAIKDTNVARKALVKYQKSKKIVPSEGRLGKKTIVQLFNDIINLKS